MWKFGRNSILVESLRYWFLSSCTRCIFKERNVDGNTTLRRETSPWILSCFSLLISYPRVFPGDRMMWIRSRLGEYEATNFSFSSISQRETLLTVLSSNNTARTKILNRNKNARRCIKSSRWESCEMTCHALSVNNTLSGFPGGRQMENRKESSDVTGIISETRR